MTRDFSLNSLGINANRVRRNPSPEQLYEHAAANEGAVVLDSGALATFSGDKTGRSPKDKRIVVQEPSQSDVWWGSVNIAMSPEGFHACRERALDFLRTRPEVFVVDGYAGWDPDHRVKVRAVCARAYHALFIHNLLIRPDPVELADFGEPDLLLLNAGDQPAPPGTPGVSSTTSVALDLDRGEMVILGTNYAGEMKKGIFTAINYWMPTKGTLSMHCSANQGTTGDVALFFGLSGTGKTTLSSDPDRRLIGDDEHCWSDQGVFNIEGGCYAKCLDLKPDLEPVIFRAIRRGAVLENVVFDQASGTADYSDRSITENTRACYPIEHVPGALIPCVADHPSNIIFLTCDAFGVLPPVSRLTRDQAMYHFLSGYTAKVAGTEIGVTEPQITFSACFGAAFMVLHPMRYANLLAQRMNRHHARAWLVNTGWTGGPPGVGSRIKLAHTRAIVAAIHGGHLIEVPTTTDPIFHLAIPTACPELPSSLLEPRKVWADPSAYDQAASRLAQQFHGNFAAYADQASAEVRDAGPRV